jgi:hypothetical protein
MFYRVMREGLTLPVRLTSFVGKDAGSLRGSLDQESEMTDNRMQMNAKPSGDPMRPTVKPSGDPIRPAAKPSGDPIRPR